MIGASAEHAVPSMNKAMKEDARNHFETMDADDSGGLDKTEYSKGIDVAHKGFMELFADLAVQALIHDQHDDL